MDVLVVQLVNCVIGRGESEVTFFEKVEFHFMSDQNIDSHIELTVVQKEWFFDVLLDHECLCLMSIVRLSFVNLLQKGVAIW